jgi:hypothetical protein
VANRPELVRPWWLLPLGRLDPRWWIGVALLMFGYDYLAGPEPMFPVLYCIPVFVAAWYSGTKTSMLLAAIMPLVHMAFLSTVWGPTDLVSLASTVLRGVLVALFALWIARFAEHERAVEQHVQTLEGLLPICSFCKSIRNEKGEWERLEAYISDRSEALFSHGFCAECQKTHYPDADFQ